MKAEPFVGQKGATTHLKIMKELLGIVIGLNLAIWMVVVIQMFQ